MIHVVLHRSIYPRNVGMCARAMANMGATQLILVAPRCSIHDVNAKQGAAHAQTVLKNAHIYDSISDFQSAEGEGIRIALSGKISGKDGRLKSPSTLDETLKVFGQEKAHPFNRENAPIYLLFGPEDDGLSSEEMEMSHHICRLPTFGEITSLNLSHAVLLTLYMVRTAHAAQTDKHTTPTEDGREFKEGPIFYPKETIRRWLLALGFDLSSPRITVEKTLNRIFLSQCPTVEELRIVDSVLQQTVRKLSRTE